MNQAGHHATALPRGGAACQSGGLLPLSPCLQRPDREEAEEQATRSDWDQAAFSHQLSEGPVGVSPDMLQKSVVTGIQTGPCGNADDYHPSVPDGIKRSVQKVQVIFNMFQHIKKEESVCLQCGGEGS